ncbi:SMI1/KNR4 family protein [Actinacidiphila acidipaludis]|uniref:SMI1/KNR4 family protein n=1 Tax=Actinacidiphila acidipaludis TaxID=2873382 RepID=A0ABS7QHN0_9ACTN|nr:SMI1/KNR4 family protein [Streptomyces acidipaludis]MBY8882682.1 SMI1/KNR4 family protein [Streptomyces acidipaludis]
MPDALSRLAKLFPPPAVPVAAPPWERSRAEIGLDFPSDYRGFVDLYGAGRFSAPDSLACHVHAPTSRPLQGVREAGFKGYVERHASETGRLFGPEGLDETDDTKPAYRMFPEPDGLLVWGENEQGDLFFWLTSDADPDRWPVVMWARGPVTAYRFDMGMVDVLLGSAQGEIPNVRAMRSPHRRWTMTADWNHDRMNISAGPASP